MVRVKFPCWVSLVMGLTYKDAIKDLFELALIAFLFAFIGFVFPWLTRVPVVGWVFNPYNAIELGVTELVVDFVLFLLYLMHGGDDDDVIRIG